MNLEKQLRLRSADQCELCHSSANLSVYTIKPEGPPSEDDAVLICKKCNDTISATQLNPADWRCIADAMWNENIPVQVLCYRILSRMQADPWASGLLGQMYLDEENLKLAISAPGGENAQSEMAQFKTVDSNGTQLLAGDSVTLIKDLEVKGANFTAKRGTLVKNINLTDDPKFIEGRVNGTTIVLVAAYLKKA